MRLVVCGIQVCSVQFHIIIKFHYIPSKVTKIEYNQVYHAKLIDTIQILQKKSKRRENSIRCYIMKKKDLHVVEFLKEGLSQ